MIKKALTLIVCTLFLLTGQGAYAELASLPASMNVFNTVFTKIENEKSTEGKINPRLFRHLYAYKVTVTNLSNEAQTISISDIALITNDNLSIRPVSQKHAYKKSKTNPVLSSVVVSSGVALLTLGALAVPAIPVFLTTFALENDTNNTLKKDLSKYYFEQKILKPKETAEIYVFVPINTKPIKVVEIE